MAPAGQQISPAQKLRMEQLSSVFENGTTAFQYGYAENINDGRGITCGRVGFTTGTGDWYLVVRDYTAVKPGNALAAFLPRLAEIAKGPMPNADTAGLDGMIAATAAAANDPDMRTVQDRYVDSLIYNPALVLAGSVGVTSALSIAALYDAVLTHGEGSDPDSTGALIAQATRTAGGTPATGVPEAAWLRAFLEACRQDMLHPAYAPSTAAWTLAVGRIDVFEALLTQGNWSLNAPIDTGTYGVTVP